MASQNNKLADTLEALIAQYNGVVDGLRGGSLSLATNNGERIRLLKTSHDIIDAIKLPQDDIMESLPMWPGALAIRLFMKWGVFEIIPKDGTISYSEIASKLGADVGLISRKPHFSTNMAWLAN
jgi:hypothetical protein